MQRIYLASPYSHDDKDVMTSRFVNACLAAGNLMNQGLIVFSPIAHSHSIAQICELPTDWSFWEEQDMSYLVEWANKLYVLDIDGWEESRGVQAEIDVALQLDKPVRLVDNEGQLVKWIER